MKTAERKTVNPRVVFFAGKAAPACMSFAFPLSKLILDASKSRLYRKAGLWSEYFFSGAHSDYPLNRPFAL